MPLDMIVDSLDSIPEALKTEYTAKDGKFHLNVNGLEDNSGLKSALQKERDRAAKAEKSAKEWAGLGKTPTEIGELLTAQETARLELEKKAGNFDGVLKQHQDKAAATLAEMTAKLTGERDAALASERGAIVKTELNTALVKGKATSEGMILLPESLGKRIKFETVDGERVISILQADGKTPMVGSGKDGLATFDDLIAESKKQFSSLFEGSGAGGSGAPPKQGKTGSKTMARAEWNKLSPLEQHTQIKAGVRPVD